MDVVGERLEIVAGVALVLAVFFDLFQTVILPRPAIKKLALVRYLLRALWRGWRAIGIRMSSIPRREGWLATSWNSDSVVPGHSAQTRMPWGFISSARPSAR